MNRFSSSSLLLQIKWSVKLYILAAIAGAMIGILILHPASEIVFFYEYEQYEADALTASQFVFGQLHDSLRGRNLGKTIFYSVVGTLLGLLTAGIYSSLSSRLRYIQQLSEELEKDVKTLISQGESSSLEFKSSFRWDIKQSKVNRALEFVILKTIAGFMNINGGTLLIGVADNGQIIGLEKDYQSLKKTDRDGFEQAIITSLSTNLGTDLCQYVRIVFHSVSGHDICRVIVIQAPRAVFIKHEGNTKFYTRTGKLRNTLQVVGPNKQLLSVDSST
jgi:hypothetical protein